MKWILIALAMFAFTPAQAAHAPWLEMAKAQVGKTAGQLGVRRNLWCAAGTNKILRKAGYRGTGSDAARSFARWGRATTARPGAIAVMRRGKSGGHVAIVVKDLGSTVLTVSPNSRGKVRYVKFSKKRIYAYRWPASA
jgi:uncharacterized protein (TIGR02594 family)